MEYGVEMAYPLHWPDGWRREKRRARARYRVTFVEARAHVLTQVRLLNGANPVISSNIQLRRDGLPYASGFREPTDPGVAVYWTSRGRTHVMACDRWTKTIDNLRGLGLALDAMRAIERSGASEILERAFAGFASLPAPAPARVRPWREVLGFSALEPVTIAKVREMYRVLARLRHPDAGGSHELMVELNAAREAALAEMGVVAHG